MKNTCKFLLFIAVNLNMFVFCQEGTIETTSSNDVVLVSEVKWDQLNPARGDKSPKAATLWGNRHGLEATGFLFKPSAGFKSPPHIHNVSYRGVVIRGFIHNDDPDARYMWMPKGSFWTQPKGEEHITAAKGDDTLAYIEIDEAPYLVLPSEKAFDSEEKPINVHESNIVWVDQPGTLSSVQIAFLWGKTKKNQLNGSLVKLPGGFTGKIHSDANFRVIIIQGQLSYQIPGEADVKIMEPGSYFSSKRESLHQISCKVGEDSIIYVRTKGKFKLISVQSKK